MFSRLPVSLKRTAGFNGSHKSDIRIDFEDINIYMLLVCGSSRYIARNGSPRLLFSPPTTTRLDSPPALDLFLRHELREMREISVATSGSCVKHIDCALKSNDSPSSLKLLLACFFALLRSSGENYSLELTIHGFALSRGGRERRGKLSAALLAFENSRVSSSFL